MQFHRLLVLAARIERQDNCMQHVMREMIASGFARRPRQGVFAERIASEDATTGGESSPQFSAFISQQQSLRKDIIVRARIKPG